MKKLTKYADFNALKTELQSEKISPVKVKNSCRSLKFF